jgi:hypothetical protein
MISIREGTFETNSSSTHSLTICSSDEYKAWEKGETVFNEDSGTFVKLTDLYDASIEAAKKNLEYYRPKKATEKSNEDYYKRRVAILEYVLEHANKEFFEPFIKRVLDRNGEVVSIFDFGYESEDDKQIDSLYDLYDKNFEGATDEAVALELANELGEKLVTEEHYYEDDYLEGYCESKVVNGVEVYVFGRYGFDG